MQLENFNSAWKQLKLSNAMQHVDRTEILSIIDGVESNDRSSLQRVLFTVAIFIVVTIFVQGG